MTFNAGARQPQMLGDHYRIERELGHGGMATVYLCVDVRTGEHAAVKVLRPELGSVVTKERFFREIAFVSELDHPRIPRVIESGTAGDLPFYSMEFIEGESLRDRLQREPQLPLEEAIRLAKEIAKPMSYAHARGLVHRDIKPENILLRGSDVYVLDFGVARAIAGSAGERLTRTGITLGTPAYMSPEQVTADRDLDYRSDIFSFGCVVYEMLAGSPPYRGATPQILMASRFTNQPRRLRDLRHDVPEPVDTAIITAMARFPDDRFQSAEEFAAALRIPTVTEEAQEVFGSSASDELLTKLRESFRDSYEVQEEIKGGGMSRLFLAKDLTLNRRVVIKILPPELVSQMMLARFKRESEVTARLQHPHILPVISAGVRDGLVHYIMPFIDGESLRGRIEREQRMPMNDALRLLREVMDALSYAHKNGIIHRDLKPENILIQDGHAVLADFGIAAALSGDAGETTPRLTGTGMSLGTIGYMAPEQALGERNVDARADIYAVGVIGYEMLAGTPPFTGATDQAILVAHLTRDAQRVDDLRDDTPRAIADAIHKAMQKDPASRFQTAAEFRLALDAEPTSGRATRTFKWKKLRTIPRKWAIGVPLALIVAAVSSYLILQNRAKTGAVERVTIAIAPFNALNTELGLWREGMVDILARNLDGVGPFLTVSPTVAIKGFTGTADRNSASELARRTNAQYAIYGTVVGSASDTVRLRATLVNLKNAKPWDYEGRDSTVEAAAAKFTVAVLKELGKTHRIGAVRQSSFGSLSIDALRAFLQGEQLFRRTSWDSAAASYARAIRHDGNFAIALRREAQVMGWQKDGKDSVARHLWLKAGTLNRGLSPRDSLLIVADSLSAALAPVLLDSMNWKMVRRLFETVNSAVARYPDDPEVWYALGEARFHYGWSSTLGVTDRNILDAFDRSIALDSAFAPAYVHAVELAFSLDGANAGRRYSAAYLRSRPTDKEAEGIAIVDRVARGGVSGAATDSILDESPAAAIMAAYFILRRWPDTSQTALRLLQSANRRPRSSPTFVADSTRLWNYMPLQLAYHGRLSEAYLLIGNRPSRMFVEMALLGAIPPDTATNVMIGWTDQKLRHAYLSLPWFASRGDSQQLRRLIERADSESSVGTELPRRSARYRAASARAYLSLVRRDTADAIKRFTALADTLCVACYVDRLEAAKLLAARGRLQEAESLVSQRVYNLITPIEILIAFERARIAARLGHRDEALRSYRLVIAAWSSGDANLQSFVDEARRESVRLGQARPPP